MDVYEEWIGWKNGKRAGTYPSRSHADAAIRRREIDSASPASHMKPRESR